jgi:hypothetical protein
VNDFDAWDARTRDLLEQAYVEAGDGPRGSGSGQASLGDWRAKRQQLAVPMDRDGTWLDVGCANGFLMATLPSWCAERDVTIEPYGPELLPKVADLARALHPTLNHLEGKNAFDSEIENEGFVGSPALDVDRVIEEDDTVVAIGTGSGTQTNGDVFEFAFCTVFTFAADLIRRVESFIVPLQSAAE